MPTRVQQVIGSAAATPFVLTLGQNVTPGSALILSIMDYFGTTQDTITPTGGGISTWTLIKNGVYGSGSNSSTIALYVGFNSSGGTNSVSIAYSGAHACANLSEWIGFGGTLDGVGLFNHSASTTPTTATYTTSANGHDFIIACGGPTGSSYSSGPTNGFTALTNATRFAAGVEVELYTAYFQDATANTAYSTSWTTTTSQSWVTVIGGLIVPPPPPPGDMFIQV